jgi:YgiT-type zinc finger domain-containing protein
MMTTDETATCPICGSPLISKKIEYFDDNDGHFLIVREVPVRECVENGHQFMHASIAKKIEKLFELDRNHAVIPKEVIVVPVVELDMTT